MNFAAMATWQAWLVIAAVMAAAVWLFLLKIRPPQIRVPSLTLWSRVLNEQREQSWWERYRKAISLLIAALITLALLFAVLRPQRTVSGSVSAGQAETRGAARHTTSIVIDSSWSMLAQTSNGETRWDRAVARARALATAAGGEDIALSTTADGLVEGPTPDVALIEAALDRISPSGGHVTLWPRVDAARATFFLTDGAVARPLDAGVIVESVFEAADNVAITAFDVRAASTVDTAGQAFLEVANYAKSSQDVHITLVRGTASVLDVHVDLAAGAAVQRVVPLARAGDARIRARVSAGANALVIDDDAVALIPGVQTIAVTVVTDQPGSLGPLLSQEPGVTPAFVSAANYKPGAEDLVIFDRVLPAAAPAVPALYIAPPSAPALAGQLKSGINSELIPDFNSNGRDEKDPHWVDGAWHPLLYGVDTHTMALDRARAYDGRGLVPVAFSATRAPLIYVRDTPEQRFAVFTFSVTDSKLMFAVGFPVLMGNAIEWLAHPTSGDTRRPGPAVFTGSMASVVGPDGKNVPVTRVGDESMAQLTRPGFYEAASGGARSVVAVNAGDPETSDLQRTRLPESARAGGPSGAERGRPWWLLAGLAACFLLAAEWWTWQRRVTV